MALTRCPKIVVGTFKGQDVIIKSNNPLENYEKFVITAKELSKELEKNGEDNK